VVGRGVVVVSMAVGAVGEGAAAGARLAALSALSGQSMVIIGVADDSAAELLVAVEPSGWLPAAQGAAHALVPAISDTPTAAASSRPAAAGAIRRSKIRPHRPGRPGNPAAVRAPATATLHSSRTQTSTLAASNTACSATASTATRSPATAGKPVNWLGQVPGDGSTAASPAKPTTQPANCRRPSQEGRRVPARPLGSGGCQSAHLTAFDMS